nr:extracellular matrix protein 2 [Solea senegalensis]
MTHLPEMYNLEATKLDLAENHLSGFTAQSFSGLPNLDTLDLSKNQLYEESFSEQPLSSLTSLKKLNLDGNQLTRIPTLLPPSLAELNLNNNRLITLTEDSFKGLTNLLTLELQENILHEGSVSPLTFKPLKKLQRLQLDNNRFRYLPMGLPSSLQELRMKGNQILQLSEEPLRGCSNLKVLDLNHNLLHEQRVVDQAWRHLKSLEDLDLSNNQFTSVPMNLPGRLKNLSLQHNSIRHIRAFTFRHLRPGLQFLGLSYNFVSNEGIERHSFVGTFRSLKELLLDNNRLNEVPHCIRQLKNLQVLRLDNNQIRLVRQWGVCHPQNSGSTLMTLHLENNYLKVENVPPKAFSCLVDVNGLFL